MDKLKIIVEYGENGDAVYSFSDLDMVGIKFNPSGNDNADNIKVLGAAMMGMCINYSPIVSRQETSIAITSIEQAMVWAINSISHVSLDLIA